MKRRGLKDAWGGFTIVETLIVLAVSGVMLISVIALISGKQNKTEFDQGINQSVSQLQQQAHDVSIGYYPDITNLQCNTTSGSLGFTTSTATHGANMGCVYLGKVLQFGLNANASSNEQYAAMVLAGCQLKSCLPNTEPAESLADSKPTVIYPTAAHSSYPNPSDLEDLQNGLQLVKLCYYLQTDPVSLSTYPACPHQTSAIAVLQSQASTTIGTGGPTCGGLCSGSQQFALYGVLPSAAQGTTQSSLATYIDSGSTTLVPATKATLCVRSGTTDQSGLITIDGTGGSVSVEIKNGGYCS